MVQKVFFTVSFLINDEFIIRKTLNFKVLIFSVELSLKNIQHVTITSHKSFTGNFLKNIMKLIIKSNVLKTFK